MVCLPTRPERASRLGPERPLRGSHLGKQREAAPAQDLGAAARREEQPDQHLHIGAGREEKPLTCSRHCRFASAGPCDRAETCTGTSAACPADGFAPPTTLCRAAAGPCDVAETCTGTNAACPADSFASAATVCRASAGPCDVAETCTGASAACPADALAPVTKVCRASAGPCDVAETCTGISSACPPDGFLQASLACRPAAGPCDVTEVCSGTSADCPPDGFLPASTICRPSTGTCDPAENCTGSSAACPPDISQGVPAPTGLSGRYSSAGAVLTWNPVPGTTAYYVQRSWPSGGPYTAIAIALNPTYTDPDLAGGLTYYYTVTSIFGCGNSANSNQVSVSSPPLPRTLPLPPRDPGCYVGTANGWQLVSCTPYDQLGDVFKKHPGPAQNLSDVQPPAIVRARLRFSLRPTSVRITSRVRETTSWVSCPLGQPRRR